MRLNLILLSLVVLIHSAAQAQRPEDIANYINTYKDLAMAEMKRTGVPAAIKLAQGIHETQAGTSELVRQSNNHFGIKCKDNWNGDKVFHDDDQRAECFRSYITPEQSYRDHSDFLKSSPRYAFLFQLDPTDYSAWAYGLKRAGYATNFHYPQILVKLIEDYQLQQYTLIALGKMSPDSEVLVGAKTGADSHPIAGISSDDITPSPPARPAPALHKIQHDYPTEPFYINNTRVVLVKSGTALLTVAEQYGISFARLLDFNDLDDGDILREDQLVFLQRKRKQGSTEFHLVQEGETLYDICQQEAIRMENLLDNNHLSRGMQPAVGEKLYLRQSSPSRPLLADQQSLTPASGVRGSTTHVVQSKETLYSISKKYGVSLSDIKNWNKLDSLEVKTGQQLVILKK